MKAPTGIPLSVLSLIAFLVIGGASTLLVRHTIDQRQQEVVVQLGEKESNSFAEQIYQHIYSVMRKGWDRAEAKEVLARISEAYPDIELHLVRSSHVADQYGDDAASATARSTDPDVRSSLQSGARLNSDQNGTLRFILPLQNKAECMGCHSNPENSINGLIDIRIPVAKLSAPIQATLSPLLNLITALVVGIFLIIFLLMRQQIIKPIARLSEHIGELTKNIDTSGELPTRRFWPREICVLANQFNNLINEVRDNHHRLTELAVRDKLTGLYNRRYFDEMLARTLDQAQRKGKPLCLIMLDLDGFKPINDRHGHAMGDIVLADVAKTLMQQTRDGDICSRVGGDEFLVIAVDCDLASADHLAKRIITAISELSWSADGDEIRVGASVGIATYPDHADKLSTLLAAADEAMYENKRARKASRPTA